MIECPTTGFNLLLKEKILTHSALKHLGESPMACPFGARDSFLR